MSTTIDQRVVEMQFDNRHFERNVSNTMSTLDKLKQKLNLSGASKGLENVNTAAKNVNMNGLAQSVENVRVKFSALQVMGVTALTNITNQAVNAGKKIVSALTIDPIKSGLNEYETKMGSIQTILANTQHQGTTMDDVTAALNELNLYADKTIYNFQEMTRNIGTFTAAGVDLGTSVKSIQGIANLAAVSGSTSQQASTAMYQLSQALATGTVKLMDWNSVVNAGMGGKVFQNALIRTAAMLDGSAQSVEAWQAKHVDAFGSFRDSLTEGEWITSEVLTETLKQFTMAAEEGTEEWEAFKKSLMDKGYSEAQAVEILKMANTATDAATKVKTFTQLFDTLKESAQSGWAQTWELIFGDFEEAKEFFTGLSDMLGGLLNSMSDFRNGIFGEALDSNWDKLTDKISKAGHTTTEYEDAIRKVWVESGKTEEQLDDLIETHGSLVKAIKSGVISSDILKKALSFLTTGVSGTSEAVAGFVDGLKKIERILGFGSVGDDVKSLQTALEALGFSVGECKIDGIIGPDTTAAIKEFQKEVGLTVDGIAGPETIAALEKAGKSLADVTGEAEEADASYDELIDNITKKGGRELFLESFSNVINSIVGVLRALGSAWANIFPAQNAQNGLFKALEGFNEFTKKLRLFDEVVNENGETVIKFTENGEKIRRVFEGIFAVVDVLTTLLGGGFKIAFEFVKQLLGYFNLDMLDVAAGVGDALVAFRDLVDGLLDFSPIIEKVGPFVERLVAGIKNLIKAVKGSAAFQRFVEYLNGVKSGLGDLFGNIPGMDSFKNLVEVLKNAGGSIKDWIETLKSSKNLPADIISGLAKGIREGAPEVWSAIVTLATELWAKFCEVLGIHSPSTVFMSIGKFIIAGLILGLVGSIPGVKETIISIFNNIVGWVKGVMPSVEGGFGAIWEVIKNVFGKITTFLSGIDWGSVFAIGLVASALFVIKQLSDALQALAAPFEGFSNFMDSLADAVDNVSKGISKKLKADAFKSIADAILVLAIAFAAIAFTVKYAGTDSVWAAIGILAGLVIAMGVLSVAIGKLGPSDIKQLGVYVLALASLSFSILILAAAMAVIANIDETAFGRAIGAVVLLGAMVVGLVAATKLSGASIGDVGGTLLKVTAAILIMAYIMKIISGMSGGDIAKGIFVIAMFGGIITGLIAATKMFDHYSGGVGKTILEISAAILLLVFVAKLIAKTPWDVLGKGILGIALFGGVIAELILVTNLAKNPAKIGGTLLAMSAAIGILAIVVRMLGGMEWEALGKGVAGVGALAGIITGLTAAVRLAGKDAPKIAATLIAMSTAILILAGTSILLSMVSIEGLAKGITAVGILSFLMSMMVRSLKGAQNVVGSIIAMTVAIGILAIAMAALSLIPTEKLLPAAGALTAVMSAMALMMYSIKSMKGLKGKDLLNLAAMVGVVALLGGIVYGLSLIPNPDNALKNVGVLSALMGAMTLMLIPLTLIGKLAGHTALKGVLALTAMVVPLAAFVAALYFMPELTVTEATLLKLVTVMSAMTLLLVPLTLIGSLGGFTALLGVLALTAMVVPLAAFCLALNYLPDVTKATGNVILLTTLMTAMTMLLIPLTLIGFLAVGAFAGVAALTAMVIPLAAFGIALALLPDITDSIGTLNILIGVMYTMTNLLYLLAPIGPLALIGVTALAALEAVMVSLGAFATVVGALDFIGLGTFIDKGIPILEKLAHALGSIIGNVFSGLIEASEAGLSRLPTIGQYLSDFMTNCEGFISGVKMVDDTAIAGVNALVGAMLGLTAAQFLNGIVSLIEWAPSFADLGQQLSDFVIAAYPFIRGAQMMDETAVNGVKCLVDTLLLFTGASLLDGLTSWLTGGIDFKKFGDDLAVFGDCVVSFSNKLTEGKIDPAAVQAAADAGKMIIELCNNLPKEGGWVGAIFGDSDLGKFSNDMSLFGRSIVGFSQTVDGNVKKSAVEAAKNAGMVMVELMEAIPKTDGILQLFTGTNDLTTFGDDIKAYGQAVVDFADTVGERDLQTAADAAKNAGIVLTELQNAVPDSGGVKGFLFGDNDLGTFGDNLRKLGEGLYDFSVEIMGVGITNISNATDAVIKLVNMAKGMSGADFGGVESFADSLGNIGALSVQNFVKAFKNAATDAADAGRTLIMNTLKGVDSAKTDFKNAGVNLVLELGTGISKAKGRAKAFATTMIADTLSAIREKYTSFKNAGEYLVEGFGKGIDENIWMAEAEARAMANAAEKAAKDALKVNSPSKVFIPLGKAIPEGLVKGMDMMGSVVSHSSEDMAHVALSSTRGVLANIADAVNSDIDTQPTIRPVLDLSDISSGAGAIGGLFGDQLVGVSANAGSISAAMNLRQNGANNDVISAIKDLGRKMGTSTGNTYMINGLSYNEGDDVSEALKTIVGAVRREGRS